MVSGWLQRMLKIEHTVLYASGRKKNVNYVGVGKYRNIFHCAIQCSWKFGRERWRDNWWPSTQLLRCFQVPALGQIDCKLVSLMKMNFERAVSFSFRELSSEENENEEMGQQHCGSVWIRFQRRSPASTLDATANDCISECTWAGMTTNQRKTAVFWNSWCLFVFFLTKTPILLTL